MEKDYLSKQITKGMKGYLCICILIHHINLFSGIFNNTYFGHFINRLGGWSVAVFFFISGYGLFKSYEEKGQDYINTFLQKRLIPFYLTYYFFVMIYCAILHKGLTIADVVKSFTFGGTVVSFGWYFQYIGVYYILFLLCFKLIPKATTIVYSLVLLLFSIVCVLIHLRFMCVFSFLAGILFAKRKNILDRCMKSGRWIILFGSFITFFAVYAIYIYSFIFGRLVINPYIWEVCMMISDLAVIIFAVTFSYITRKLPIISNPASDWLGEHSLEIYASQGIVLYLFSTYVNHALIYMVMCVIGTILLAFVLHTLIRTVKGNIKI